MSRTVVGLRERAAEFWTKRGDYPDFPFIEARRKIEVDYLLTRLDGVKRVLDVGCGDGSLIRMLATSTEDIDWCGLDIGSMWLRTSQGDVSARFEQRDVFDGQPYPEADLTVCSGVLPYAFSGYEVAGFIESIQSPRLHVRVPCSVGFDEIRADGHSDQLGGDYVAVYRTVEQVLKILKQRFDVPTVFRIYPDSIESAFGTKQFVFEGVLR